MTPITAAIQMNKNKSYAKNNKIYQKSRVEYHDTTDTSVCLFYIFIC